MTKETTTGILGGSFNPPHYGHRKLAEAALASGRVDRVVFIPAATPPHKAAPSEASPATRLAMTRLLAADDPRFSVNGLELERTGPSYTVDTVRRLKAGHPGMNYRLVIGSDMAIMFAKWREYRELLRLSPPLVAERPDAPLAGLPEEDFPGMTAEERDVMLDGRFPMPLTPINSTLIRRRIAERAPEAELLEYLPQTILDFIKQHRLYGISGSALDSI